MVERTDASCVFCRILAGEEASSFVYEEDDVVAFMDISQETGGHVLVIPRGHYESLAELPAEIGGRLFAAGQRVGAALRRSKVGAEGIMLSLADGAAAGQEVPHVHLHVHARFSDDPFNRIVRPAWEIYRVMPPRSELNRLAGLIRAGFE